MARLDKYGMNVRQRKFADRYLLNGNNAAEAYRYAYNPKAEDKKAANMGHKFVMKEAIKGYIEKRQEELRQIAEEKHRMNAEELIELLTGYIRGEREDVDYVVETESDGPMGSTTSVKRKRVSKQWAADLLTKLIGADKSGAGNQNNVIIEEVD